MDKNDNEFHKGKIVVNEIYATEIKACPILQISNNEQEILRFEPNGDIYVKGNLTTNDLEVVEAFREFLKGQGFLT